MSGAVLVSLAFAWVVGQPEADAFGGDEVDYTRIEKDAMRRRIAEDRVRTRFLRKEEASLLSGIDALDEALHTRNENLDRLEASEHELQEGIRRADRDLADSQVRGTALRKRVGRRLAAMVRLRKTPVADLLDRATSHSAARRLRDYLRHVAGHDTKLIGESRVTVDRAARASRQLRAQRAQLDFTREQTREQVAQTKGLREERRALLSAIRRERGLVERLARELAATKDKLEREEGVIRGILPPPSPRPGGFARQKGRLIWPAVGRVEVPFGKSVDPASGMVMVHPGLDIRAPAGVPVRASFAGRVAFAARLQGAGNVVIVDHGRRWYTLYGHLDAFGIGAGDRVARGQPVGTLGATDSDKGPHLYFEIRRQRRAVDPMAWLSP